MSRSRREPAPALPQTDPAQPASFARRRALAAALLPVAAGCSPARLVNAIVPKDGFEYVEGIGYGSLPSQRLDAYIPRDPVAPSRPVVVFFYGGSWQDGERGDYLFVGEALASCGFVAVLPDYRKYPEVRFPGFVDDGAMAVAWARRNAGRFGGDPARVHVMGHSAGAHIAAMLALDGRYLAGHGLGPGSLAGLIGLAGPYDFLPLSSARLERIFAPADGLASTQPVNFASAAAPPSFLATGDSDTTVRPRNTVSLAARLRDAGVRVTERSYPGLNHFTIVGALAAPLRSRYPVLGDIRAFVEGEPGA